MRDVNWGWTDDGVNFRAARLGDALDLTRSPIERQLLGSVIHVWLSASPDWRLSVQNGDEAEAFVTLPYIGGAQIPHLILVPQRSEDPYTIDLSARLSVFRHWSPQYAIECDGHEHHSTKEQRRRDASRDRFLVRKGWRVLRFTGSEIYADPDGCAREAIESVVAGLGEQAGPSDEFVQIAAPLGLWE